MIALVPAEMHAELASPDATLLPYTEDGPLPDGLADAEAIFRWVRGTRFAEIVEKGPRVRWLHTPSAGVDHVLVPAVRQKANLTITDSGPIFAIPIGEFVLGWMLALSHRVPELLIGQTERRWQWYESRELAGQTVGIIGLGPIGQGIATRCRALGMRTLGLRRSTTPCAAVDHTLTGHDGLVQLLTQSDWVVVAAALTDETRCLLGPAELALLKPSAQLINIGRGALIDETALQAILERRQLAGAVLDVFTTEPLPPTSPFWSLPNCYVTCHSSAWTDSLRERQKAYFLEQLHRFAHGQPLESVVDLQRGY